MIAVFVEGSLEVVLSSEEDLLETLDEDVTLRERLSWEDVDLAPSIGAGSIAYLWVAGDVFDSPAIASTHATAATARAWVSADPMRDSGYSADVLTLLEVPVDDVARLHARRMGPG